MILVTWNCCRGPFLKKAALLDALGAHIAVLQECPRPPAESDGCLWFGDNPRQGIAIIAKPPYSLARLPANSLARVEVARYEEWKRHSDHRPLLLEIL